MRYLRLNERETRVARSMAREELDGLKRDLYDGRYFIPAVGCVVSGLVNLFILFCIEMDYEFYIEGLSWYTRPEPVTGWQWLVTATFIIVGLALFLRGYISYKAPQAADDAR